MLKHRTTCRDCTETGTDGDVFAVNIIMKEMKIKKLTFLLALT
jgi:hypothetical protein